MASLKARIKAQAHKTLKLRHRVIAHAKARHPSRVLRRAYERAKAQLHRLRVAASRPQRLRTSQRGLDLIAGFEGLRLVAYRDAVGVLTIGYGHTHGVRAGERISAAEAMRLLKSDVRWAEAAVRGLHVKLNQHQFDALVSFVFNLGPGILDRGHTIGDRLRRRDYRGAADAMLMYDYAGGRRLPGLTRRREAERALFLS